jgi:hypothetical protein
MPNAAATDGPPRTDEARPSVASVRINVPSFYQFIRSLRSKVFVTFGLQTEEHPKIAN